MSDHSGPDETTPTVATSGDRGVGIGRDVTNSTIITGDIRIGVPVTTALHQLRAPLGDFVGREPEIDTLINARKTCRVARANKHVKLTSSLRANENRSLSDRELTLPSIVESRRR